MWKKQTPKNLNISEAIKKLWQDPEYRALQFKQASERSKRQWQNPAYRAKMSMRASGQVDHKGIWDRKREIGDMPPHLTDGSLDHVRHAVVKCPHCGKEGGYIVMQRHHFNRCKIIGK